MLDIIVAVILGVALVYFLTVVTQQEPKKKGQKRDSKGRFTK